MKGIIIRGVGGFYYVKTESEVFQCRARGLFKKKDVTPKVGDFADIQLLEDGTAVINEIEDRKNSFVRPAVANVDLMVIVVSAGSPKADLYTLDKMLAGAEQNNVKVILCINKTDDADGSRLQILKKTYEGIYPIFCISAEKKTGINEFKKALKGRSIVFSGVSGVGKSTIINELCPNANMDTGDISNKTGKGKHTTRHIEIFETEDGIRVFDTPGFSSFEPDGIDENKLDELFPEMAVKAELCRYSDCRHMNEPGCEIKAAVEKGEIEESRYESYVKLYNMLKEKNSFQR